MRKFPAWKLVDAYAINESGQIVGPGFKDGRLQAFLLNPIYSFSGFFAPVDNPQTVNAVNAGRAVPVKFSLSGDQGLDIFEETYPRSQQVGRSRGRNRGDHVRGRPRLRRRRG